MYAQVYKIEKDSGKGNVPLTLVGEYRTKREAIRAAFDALSKGAKRAITYRTGGRISFLERKGD